MDWASIKELLSYGLATFLVVAGFLFSCWGVTRLVGWAKPWAEELFRAAINAWQKVADSAAVSSANEQRQTPVILRIDENVTEISARQVDPDSMMSNVHTHEYLRAMLHNDVSFAKAGIVAMEALIDHHPELKESLDSAISTLKEVERNA